MLTPEQLLDGHGPRLVEEAYLLNLRRRQHELAQALEYLQELDQDHTEPSLDQIEALAELVLVKTAVQAALSIQ